MAASIRFPFYLPLFELSFPLLVRGDTGGFSVGHFARGRLSAGLLPLAAPRRLFLQLLLPLPLLGLYKPYSLLTQLVGALCEGSGTFFILEGLRAVFSARNDAAHACQALACDRHVVVALDFLAEFELTAFFGILFRGDFLGELLLLLAEHCMFAHRRAGQRRVRVFDVVMAERLRITRLGAVDVAFAGFNGPSTAFFLALCLGFCFSLLRLEIRLSILLVALHLLDIGLLPGQLFCGLLLKRCARLLLAIFILAHLLGPRGFFALLFFAIGIRLPSFFIFSGLFDAHSLFAAMLLFLGLFLSALIVLAGLLSPRGLFLTLPLFCGVDFECQGLGLLFQR
ncbi:hypothetical protein LMG28614_05646 [Paraburkholderia ultramafica]|uniref:Uncharacterized protein n=1 Tax=Paraburkholderia ultramafica TaxID=1544867 RepID=A0A6S7C6Y7_9BURK|nr:hypothetical protein LMG28614_05646 [Paraburkholderia ultramafica]